MTAGGITGFDASAITKAVQAHTDAADQIMSDVTNLGSEAQAAEASSSSDMTQAIVSAYADFSDSMKKVTDDLIGMAEDMNTALSTQITANDSNTQSINSARSALTDFING